MTVKVKQTPEQVIVFGEIATSLREWCKTNDKSAKDINKIIGKGASYSAGFQWLNGKGAPSKYNRILLAKATGIPEEKLTKRKSFDQVTIEKPPTTKFVSKTSDILSFTVTDTGEARIKLDVTLPMQSAVPLFRLILDAGVVMGS
jgi:hypothetical protein